MNRNDSSRSFGRIGARATTFAGLAFAAAAFVSLRGGFFTRGANAEFVRPSVAFDALQDGVIDVPSEAASIQAAIDFAPDGSTIHVSAGTYAGGIHCEGKSVTITGAGADATLIRGFANSPVLSFSGDSSDRVFLSGLSVVGGRGDAGCGIFLDSVSSSFFSPLLKRQFSSSTTSPAAMPKGVSTQSRCSRTGTPSSSDRRCPTGASDAA